MTQKVVLLFLLPISAQASQNGVLCAEKFSLSQCVQNSLIQAIGQQTDPELIRLDQLLARKIAQKMEKLPPERRERLIKLVRELKKTSHLDPVHGGSLRGSELYGSNPRT